MSDQSLATHRTSAAMEAARVQASVLSAFVQHGVPMPKPLRDSLDAIARDLGIAPLA